MSRSIKGITVEIGGNTAPLDKALQNVNKNSRSLQTELRQVDRLLKFDPTNTELLAQKQELLTQAIDNTKEKLETLKEAQRQAQQQFDRGEITQEQYRALTREVIRTEQELERLEESAEGSTQAHQQAISEMTEGVKKGMLAVGASVVATAGYALKFATEYDRAFNVLITQTGASKDEFDSLDEAMQNVYKNNFGESIEDVAQSMAVVKTNTNLAGVELQKATEYGLLLRDVFDFEITESTRAVTVMMKEFGLTSEEAYTLIAQGAQMGLNKNDDLLDTINEYSVHFKNAGFSAEEMFNSLKNGVDAGAFSVDKLGDAVKEFGIRMKDGSATDAIKALGLDVERVTDEFSRGGDVASSAMGEIVDALFTLEDPLKKNELGVALFGTMFEDLGPKAVDALMYIGGEADQTADTLKKLNEQKYSDIGSALQGLGRTINTDVILPLGQNLQPLVEQMIGYIQANGPQITSVLTAIVDAVGKFVGFLVNNSSTILTVISGVASGFAAWKTAMFISKLVGHVTAMVGAMEGLTLAQKASTVAQKLLNTVMGANIWVKVITVIAAVVSAFITLMMTNEDFRNKVIEIWNTVIDFIVNAFNTTIDTISQWVNNVINFFTSTWNNMVQFMTDVINQTVETISQWADNVINFFTSAWDSIVEFMTNALNKTIETVSQWSENVVNFFKTAWDNVKNWTAQAWQFISNLVQVGILTVAEIIKAAFIIITLPWQFIWQNCKDFLIPLWEGIVLFLQTTWTNIATWATETWNGIKDFFISMWTTVSTFISDTWNNISLYLTTKWTEIQMFAISIWTTIVTFLTTLWEGFKNWTIQLWNTIITFITTLWEGFKNWAIQLWTTISDFIKNIWIGISNYIKNVATQIKNIITNAWNSVKTTTTNVFNTISNFIKSVWNGIKSFITPIVNSISSAVSNAWNSIKSTTTNVFNGVKNTVSNVWNGIKNTITNAINSAKDGVKKAIDTMKGFFNFSWSLPKIKLPHFSIKGGFKMNPPSAPKFSVEWYKQGGIMTNPTMFGFNPKTGKAMVGGEAGAEAILPISNLRTYIKDEMIDVMREFTKVNQTSMNSLVNIENFENNTNEDIGYLMDKIAFELKRRNII